MSPEQAHQSGVHPGKEDGTAYPFGGYAYLRLGCRCEGCKTAQTEQAARNRANRKAGTTTAKGPSKRVKRVRKVVDAAGEDGAAATVVGLIQDVSPGSRPASTKAPKEGGASESDLQDFTAQILVYLTLGLVIVTTRGVDLPDESVDSLALSDEEAAAVAKPFARLFTGTTLNARYGQSIVRNQDVLEAGAALFAYTRRITKALAQIRAHQQGIPSGVPAAGRHLAAVPAPTAGPAAAPPPVPPATPEEIPASDQPSPPRPFHGAYVPGSQLGAD